MKNFLITLGGGPLTKIDHINNLKLNGKTLYFDSKYDNFVAHEFGFDFIFVNGYTCIEEEGFRVRLFQSDN